MDLRRTNSVREDNTPSRLASSSTTPCSEKLTDVSRADLVDLRSTSAGGLVGEGPGFNSMVSRFSLNKYKKNAFRFRTVLIFIRM